MFTLQRVRLDRYGYDAIGSYWGKGLPLYWYNDDDNANPAEWPDKNFEGYIRAQDRKDAKRKVLEIRPDAKFYS